MAWAILVLAGLFEIGWAIGLKYTDGFTKLWPTVGTVVSMAVSLGMLGIAMKSLPVGTAYAVWVGVGERGQDDQPGTDRRRHHRAQARESVGQPANAAGRGGRLYGVAQAFAILQNRSAVRSAS